MRTIQWQDGRVRMIDQRLLPTREEDLLCTEWSEVAFAISDMAIRGAPAIGAAAGYGLALAAREVRRLPLAEARRALDEAAAGLVATRPTAVNLKWAVDRVLATVGAAEPGDAEALAELVLNEAQAIADEDAKVNETLGRFGAELIPAGANVLTHCNAGALATVEWGTALSVIVQAHRAGKNIHVWVDETRPRQQGARLTAWELHREGVPMTLIADTAAGFYFQRGKVDAVVVGSDRVTANGDVVNKIGTYKVALLAREHGVPFYAALPLSTVDMGTPTGGDVAIEERSEDEVLYVDGSRIAPEGVRAANPAFDVTPHEMVSGIITEVGVLRPPYAEALARAFARPRGSGSSAKGDTGGV